MSICFPYFIIALIIGIIGTTVPNLYVTIPRVSYLLGINVEYKLFLISGIVVFFSAFRMISAASIDEYAYRNRFTQYVSMDFISSIKETTEPIFTGIVWISTTIVQY